MTDAARAPRDRPRLDRARRPAQGHAAPRPTPIEHPVEHPAYLHPVQSTHRPRPDHRRRHRRGRGARPACCAVLTTRNAARLASADDAELAVLQSDDVAFRGQLIGVVVAETSELARQAADAVARRLRRAAATTSSCAPTGDDLYAPGAGQRRLPDRHRRRATSRRRCAAAAVTRRRTRTRTADVAQQPAGAARHDRAVGPGERRAADALGLHPGRAPRPAASAQVFGLAEEQVRVICPVRRRRLRLQGARRTPTSCSPRWPPGRCPAGR